MVLTLLVSAACAHSHKAALQRVTLVPAGERPLALRLAAADLVVPATLAKTQRDWSYEEPCGILRGLLYGCADIPKAYQATLRRGAETWPVFYFKLGDLPHPTVGDSAVWVLRQAAVYHLMECAQRRGLTSAYCNYDLAYVVESDDDVLPAAAWQQVSEVLRTLGDHSVQQQ
jgi:hypothetical protein